MTNFNKNEKRMAYLTKEVKAHPETWVEDVVDKFVFDVDKNDPNYEEKLEKFQYIMDFQIDWYHPSKNRVYAYDLENNTYIYLDRELFLRYMRPYWRDKKEEQRHRQITVSLDELHDLYELELDEHGHLITKDNYYQFSYEEDMDEENSSETLESKVKEMFRNEKSIYMETINLLFELKSETKIAKRLGISISAVCQRLEKIRRIYEKKKKSN